MMGRVDKTSTLSRDSRQRRFRIVVIVVSVVAAIVGSVLLALRDTSEKASTRGAAATLRVPGHPGAVIAGQDALWVALSDSEERTGAERLLRIDLATGSESQSVYPRGSVSHLGRVGDRLIASLQHPAGLAELAALEWRSGSMLERHFFNPPVDQVVLRGSELWALETRPGALLRIDPRTLEPASAPLRLSRGRTLALASGAGYLWVTAADAGEVLRIDPATHAIRRVQVGGFPIGIVVTGGRVWFADHEGGTVRRLDPRSLRPVGEPIRVGTQPRWLVPAAGSLFVTDEDDGTVARIDVHSGKKVGLPTRVASPTRDGPAPSVAPAGRSVWVSSFGSKTLNRIDSTAAGDEGDRKVTVRITHVNDNQQGDAVTGGGVAGIGQFTASGAISEEGKVVVYRTKRGPVITLRYVTMGSKGTITFVTKVDVNFRTSRWTIKSGTKAYKGLHGEGTEHDNANFTVFTLSGTVWR
jgi:streptogramin lyase